MLEAKIIYEQMLECGIDFFAGVPDSLLKDFCAYITENSPKGAHVITANEGGAIAVGVGHYLATKKIAAVYMQNSGIGNAVNPLLSLADPEVYSIPMLLIIGWRGEPGISDEPQHKKQGRVMTAMLDAMEVPYEVLPKEKMQAISTVRRMAFKANDRKSPVAILVQGDTFMQYKLASEKSDFKFEMNREDAIKSIAPLLNESQIIISTTGKTSRELYEMRAESGQGHEFDFLTVGAMGHASQIAFGLANSRPKQKVVCLDGDGAAIMHMGGLAIIGCSNLQNFYHIVINNGAHDSVGGQPTVGFEISLSEIAKACGYTVIESSKTKQDLLIKIKKMLQMEGPVFLEVKVNKGARNNLGRPKSSPIQNKVALMEFLHKDTLGY